MFNKKEEFTSNNEIETVIGPSVNVEGDFAAEGDVVVEGKVSGTLKTDNHLRVGQSASITANVTAGSAIIAGEVNGDLIIRGSLELSNTAVILGDIKANTISVASGAVISGKCMVGSHEVAKAKNEKPAKDKILKPKEWKLAQNENEQD